MLVKQLINCRLIDEIKGVKFIAPTTCYALMQAVGMVNDHTTSCFRYKEINKL
ncbi:DNA-3-methyladenine glycosylase I [Psychromonas sp. Urea-02u-13]|uniref:DNA-3-methyladenine glycosylase I n=1 Tax=Psychromonas sp. Urea-02u-13 TaxID=2058326 RepID=UPI003FA6E544